MHSQRKNPTLAIPSTMIIIPATKTIVSQLIPLDASEDVPPVYQNPFVKKQFRLSVSVTALMLRSPTPKTRMSVSSAHPSVTTCRSHFSVMIRINISKNRTTAKICANIIFLLCPFSFLSISLRTSAFAFLRDHIPYSFAAYGTNERLIQCTLLIYSYFSVCQEAEIFTVFVCFPEFFKPFFY